MEFRHFKLFILNIFNFFNVRIEIWIFYSVWSPEAYLCMVRLLMLLIINYIIYGAYLYRTNSQHQGGGGPKHVGKRREIK